MTVSGNRSGTGDIVGAVFSNMRWTVRLAVVPRLGLGRANLARTVGDIGNKLDAMHSNHCEPPMYRGSRQRCFQSRICARRRFSLT